MRQVRQLMGMPITIDIPKATDKKVFDKAFERLKQIDKRFSTYKPDSEVSRFARGEIKENELSQELTQVIKACRQAEKWTDGYFSAWAAGSFDPSGYVKGWAIAQAGKTIESEGQGTYCISAGGDILSCSTTGKTWNIGIQDPANKNKILSTLKISNGAVATSGNYERGIHIIDPKTNQPADGLISVTITGSDIITADVLATACFAMGGAASEFMKSQVDYQAIIISRNQESNP